MIVNARHAARCADCGAGADVPCAETCPSRLASPTPGLPRPRAAATERHHVRGEVALDEERTAPPPGSGIPTTTSVWLGEREGLSAHEGAVVSLIVLGLSNLEIAGALYMSVDSVRTHIRSAYRTIGVTNRPQAIAWGNLHGFHLMAPAARPDEGGPR